MEILSWFKIGGGLVAALVVGYATWWLTDKVETAYRAKAIEAQAARDVADAEARLDMARAQIKSDRETIAEHEVARARADETIRNREAENVHLQDLLKARAKAVSAPPRGNCDYRPGAHGLLLHAWGRNATTDPAPVPDTPG